MFSANLIYKIEKMYFQRLSLFGEEKENIKLKIEKLEDNNEKVCIKFIYSKLPLSDIGDYPFEIFMSFVKHSLQIMKEISWASEVSEDMFLNYILFPRINTEKIQDCRPVFYSLLKDNLKNISIKDIILNVNYFALGEATYANTDRRAMGPLTMLKSGYGRCGEEATFLVNALRSLGIPARQVYTPWWAHCDNNHAWVEAYCDNKFYYLGACEPEPVLNRGWFTSASKRVMKIENRSFFPYEKNIDGTNVDKDGILTLLNLTSNYAKTKEITLRVFENQKPLSNANVTFEIINHSKYGKIQNDITNDEGIVKITCGLGSLNIHVKKDDKFISKIVNVNEVKDVIVNFDEAVSFENEGVNEFDFYAPQNDSSFIENLDEKIIENHKLKVGFENKKREDKIKKFLEEAKNIEVKNKFLNNDELEVFINYAKGNYFEVIKFLNKNLNEDAAILLKNLTEKDFLDLEEELLTLHLNHMQKFKNNFDKEIYSKYMLTPRVYFEQLSGYSKFIEEFFDNEHKEIFVDNPKSIWKYINNNIEFFSNEEQETLIATPISSLKLKKGSLLSKKVLFVSICRTFGIPARIHLHNLNIEYFFNGKFISPIEEETTNAVLEVIGEEGVNWSYYTNWSLNILKDGSYIPLDLKNIDFDMKEISLNEGNYKIITSNRLPNGNIYCREYLFNVYEGKNKINIGLRKLSYNDLISEIKFNDFKITDLASKSFLISETLKSSKNILIWISESSEPAQHVLNEIVENSEFLNKIDSKINFIFDNKNILENKLVEKVLECLKNKEIYFDINFENKEQLARNLFVDPEKLPLIMITKNGLNSFYAHSGYSVGLIDMILKIINII